MFDTKHSIKVDVPFVPVFHEEAWTWLNENCKGRFYASQNQVEFDKETDAVMFALRWK